MMTRRADGGGRERSRIARLRARTGQSASATSANPIVRGSVKNEDTRANPAPGPTYAAAGVGHSTAAAVTRTSAGQGHGAAVSLVDRAGVRIAVDFKGCVSLRGDAGQAGVILPSQFFPPPLRGRP